MYYCFGCSRGGDVIKFVMEWEKATYVEAIEILAERAGIAIVRTEESISIRKRNGKALLRMFFRRENVSPKYDEDRGR